MEDQTLDLDWTVALADLAAIQPSVSGTLDAKGHAGGKLNDLAIQADLGADLAAKGYPSGHITAKVDATGLPATPHATINAGGTLLDAPLTLGLTAEEHGVVKVDIEPGLLEVAPSRWRHQSDPARGHSRRQPARRYQPARGLRTSAGS